MTRRSPFIIWLHVCAEMWKLVLLTTAVLATVIAFALAIKPLADGKLGPQQAVEFMAYAMIPALQYVLPFAACFGATLAYHRLVVDNEATAAHAGGISHRSLLMPALASGIVLACGVWAISNYVIPRYFRSMARLVSEDATRLIVTSIRRGEAITMGDALVYADKVVEQGPDEAGGAYERMWLSGVLVVRLDKQGNVLSQGSAKSASVWLRRVGSGALGSGDDRPATQVILKPKDFVGLGPTTRGGGADAVTSFTVPNAFSDNPKFLTFDELRALREKPEEMDFVDKKRRSLALSLAQRDTIDAIRSSLRGTGKATFADPFGDKVVLKAADLRPTRREGKREPNIMAVVTEGKIPVVVERAQAGGKAVRQSAAAAFLRLSASLDPQKPGVYVTIQMQDVAAEHVGGDGEIDAPAEVSDAASGATAGKGEVKERPVSDLTYPGSDLDALLKSQTKDLVKAADGRIATRAMDADVLATPRGELIKEVDDLLREVLSKEHERLAMSLACLVMVMLGAVMAMRLRDALPLTVYFWAFFPALLAMVAISGGQQLTHAKGPVGLLVLYSGVACMGVFAMVEFGRLAKH